MTELLTFSAWQAEHPDVDLFEGTTYDAVTISLIQDQFESRQVCDNDNFERFFRRELMKREKQYYELLRIYTASIDPMVASYMERQILTDMKRTGGTTATRSGTNGSIDSVLSDGTSAEQGKTSSVGHVDDNESVTLSTDTSGTQGGTSTTEHDYSKTGTGKDDTTTDRTAGSEHLEGVTPDTSLYPQGGFPEKLAWQYASGQAENRDKSNDKTARTTDSTDVLDEHSHVEDSRNDSGSVDGTTTQTDGRDSTDTGDTERTTQDSRDTRTKTDTTSDESNTTNHDETDTGNTRERSAGRSEAPQDLLRRARDYFESTNAYSWLMSKLEVCFFSIYDFM